MGADSNIEWTSHTFNPWRGCTKVSEGCHHCYAETLSGRNPKVLGEWGPKGKRVIAAESYWKEPLKWNREAEQAGERRRVFCASLADVFEGMETMPKESYPLVEAARQRLWKLIEETPYLDWLLLTKRHEYVIHMVPVDWRKQFPSNVWLGTSVENQQAADERIPHLLKVPAKVHFLSCEPLLGAVDIMPYMSYECEACEGKGGGRGFYNPVALDDGAWTCEQCEGSGLIPDKYAGIDWVICGGESGPKARPMHPDWARSLRDQCEAAGVPYFFKQWGEYLPYEHTAQPPFLLDQTGREWDGHGLDIIDPETGDIGKDWHEDSLCSDTAFRRVGKKAAGRLLYGRTWDEFPEVTHE